ncbi:MAG TPA: hypothetical protein VFW71_03310 [Actinomycetota bacterium]|nr:hypothetical protein [Actinomycetota bacterium]
MYTRVTVPLGGTSLAEAALAPAAAPPPTPPEAEIPPGREGSAEERVAKQCAVPVLVLRSPDGRRQAAEASRP